MTDIRMTFAALTMLAISVPANAQGSYWGIGLSIMELEDAVGDSIEPANLYGHIGHDFNRHFGLESQASFTLRNDSLGGVDWYTSVFGFYLKGGIPLSNVADLYVLGGVSRVELTADLGFGTVSDDEFGSSYGLGVDLALTEDTEVFVRYMNYLEEDGLFSKVTGLNVGLGWSF